MKLTIRTKLFLGFALVLSISLIVETIGFLVVRNQFQSQVTDSLLQEASEAKENIDRFIVELEIEQESIATKYVANGEQVSPDMTTILEYLLEQNRFYEEITIVLPSGREIFNVDRSGITPSNNLSFEIQSEPFIQSLTGTTGISKVIFPDDGNTPKIHMYYPVIGKNGTPVAVIKSYLDLTQFWNVVAQIRPGDSGFAYIVDEEGRLIAHPNNELLTAGQNLSTRPIIDKLLKDQPLGSNLDEYIYLNFEGVEVIANGVKTAELNWVIAVQQETSEALQYLNVLDTGFYPTIILTIVFLGGLSFFLSNSFTRPIFTLRSMTDEVRKGNLDVIVDLDTGDEFEALGKSFNEMTTGLMNSQRTMEQDREHIAAERNKLEVIVAGINDAVIATDLDGNILLFNKVAEEMTGYTADSASNKHIEQVVHLADGDVKITMQDLMPKHQPGFEGIVFEKKDLSLTTKNNTELSVDVISSQISEAESSNLGCILTIHDVSKEKALEDMKLDFVSLAAHELRTPLTAITGYLSVFIDENEDQLTIDQLTMVTRANIASQQLVALVENLLNVSHIERGTVNLQIEPIRWADTVRGAVEDLQSRAKDKSITLLYEEPQESLPDVYVDKLRISEVVNNLIANAINYTETTGTVTVWNEVKGDEVLTYVRDTGIGIPKEALPNLFKKFFRVSGALEHGSKGTGLGLYISKSIIEMHHGKIWVESELGKGSTFIFSLPTKKYDQSTSH